MSERIWNYLDQNLSKAETEQLLSAIQANDLLKREFESCKALHQLLRELEPAEPSMAFVQQVRMKMEARPLAPQPLVKDRVKKLFWVGVSSILGTTLGLNFILPGKISDMSGEVGWIRSFMDQIMQPQEVMIGLTLLSISLLALIGLDRLLSSQRARLNG